MVDENLVAATKISQQRYRELNVIDVGLYYDPDLDTDEITIHHNHHWLWDINPMRPREEYPEKAEIHRNQNDRLQLRVDLGERGLEVYELRGGGNRECYYYIYILGVLDYRREKAEKRRELINSWFN